MLYLIKRIWQEQPLRLSLSVVALAVAGLLEGLALAAVVPLLQLVQAGGQPVVPSGRLGTAIGSVLAFLHLPFTLPLLLLMILVVLVSSQLITLAQQKLLWGSTARFEAALRIRLYRAIFHADWPFFVAHKSTDLNAALMNEASRGGQAYGALVQMIGTLIMVAVYLVLALLLSWQMTLIIGAAAVVIVTLLRVRVKRGSEYGEAITQKSMGMWHEAGEHINAAKTVKAYDVEEQTIGRFQTLAERFTRLQYLNSMNQAWVRFIYESIGVVAVFLGIYVAVTYFGISMSALVVFLMVFYRVSPRISGIQALQTQALSLIPGLVLTDRITAEAATMVEYSGDTRVGRLQRSLALDDVSFGYGDKPILRHVSLGVPAGKTVGLVGASGSGKTTIVDLILGLMQPDSGAVVVDGENLASLNVHDWRAGVGYVAQDSSFFHDTIAENVRFGFPGATREDVEEACRMAFAEEFVLAMPEGYDTMIGDRGVKVSGGQRQRLALARALVRKPELLILDEATSALDAESEGKIQRAVDRLAESITIIIVTHRLATVRNADVIHVLEHGVLVESGTWDELVSNHGRFYDLQLQQRLA
jgi:ATP-binding cassette subfamily C protein